MRSYDPPARMSSHKTETIPRVRRTGRRPRAAEAAKPLRRPEGAFCKSRWLCVFRDQRRDCQFGVDALALSGSFFVEWNSRNEAWKETFCFTCGAALGGRHCSHWTGGDRSCFWVHWCAWRFYVTFETAGKSEAVGRRRCSAIRAFSLLCCTYLEGQGFRHGWRDGWTVEKYASDFDERRIGTNRSELLLRSGLHSCIHMPRRWSSIEAEGY